MMSDLEVGQKYKKVYPFTYWDSEDCDGWSGGARAHEVEGSEIMDYCYEAVTYYDADGEGEIEYEVLAIVPMPRKYQTRVIYSVSMIWPDGTVKKSSKSHMATEAKFIKWVSSERSSYPKEYTING